MKTLQQLRLEYPQYDEYGMSDMDIVMHIAEQSKMNPVDVARYYGVADLDSSNTGLAYD